MIDFVFIAVRRNNFADREFVLPGEMDVELNAVKRNVYNTNQEYPDYQDSNPVVRFVKMKLTEVEVFKT